MYLMEQKSVFKSSIWKVFEVFVEEPLTIHYIKEISRKINLAPTSVKNHIISLEKEKIILEKKGERFIGFIANRDNESFLFYKKILNFIKLDESGLINYLNNSLYPKAIVLYGSYARGEDVEKSDIDLFILSKTTKTLLLEKFERVLNRKIHIIIKETIKKMQENLRLEIINGLVLKGYLQYG